MLRTSLMDGIYSAKISFSDNSEPLSVDFEPIINNFQLFKVKNFVLCHWQSRPKGIRGYGFYDWNSKQYHCIDWDSISISKTFIKTLQIDETIFKSVPTAVLLFPNVNLVQLGNNLWAIK